MFQTREPAARKRNFDQFDINIWSIWNDDTSYNQHENVSSTTEKKNALGWYSEW